MYCTKSTTFLGRVPLVYFYIGTEPCTYWVIDLVWLKDCRTTGQGDWPVVQPVGIVQSNSRQTTPTHIPCANYLCIPYSIVIVLHLYCSISFSTLILLVGSLTCKNRLPCNLYCVGGDKTLLTHSLLNVNRILYGMFSFEPTCLTIWRPWLLSYGHSYKASCARPA